MNRKKKDASYRVSAVSGKSGKCQGNVVPHKNLPGKFGPFLQCQGNLTLFTEIQEWRNVLKSSFSHPCTIIYFVKYMWVKGQRSTRSMINVIFVLLAKGRFPAI